MDPWNWILALELDLEITPTLLTALPMFWPGKYKWRILIASLSSLNFLWNLVSLHWNNAFQTNDVKPYDRQGFKTGTVLAPAIPTGDSLFPLATVTRFGEMFYNKTREREVKEDRYYSLEFRANPQQIGGLCRHSFQRHLRWSSGRIKADHCTCISEMVTAKTAAVPFSTVLLRQQHFNIFKVAEIWDDKPVDGAHGWTSGRNAIVRRADHILWMSVVAAAGKTHF